MALRIGTRSFGIPRGFNEIAPKGVLANRGLGQFSPFAPRKPNPQQELLQQLRLRLQLNKFLGGGLGGVQEPEQTPQAPQTPQTTQPVQTAQTPQLPQTAKFNVNEFLSSDDIRQRLENNYRTGNQLTPEMIRVLLQRKRILQNEERRAL